LEKTNQLYGDNMVSNR